jgi:hypothetical protein
MTCEQGDRHRWDERRSRCLDCGRDAATIADEVWEWLGEKEDWIDHLADQVEALRALLEDIVERLAPESAAHRYDQGRVFCVFCGACIAAIPHAAPPAIVSDHLEGCPIRRTRILLAELDAEYYPE